MNARLFAIGLSDGLNFTLPLTQADIAEACGLTAIHVNRVLRELRTAGICTLRSGKATVHRGADLVAIGQFDPAYLYLDALVVGRLKALGVA
jgi:DNA-binding transcriptional regulator YhcF (GntR family)